ncbi:hypothetical protein SAMN05216585_2186 [Pseudomonas chlororaphis]|nr:hypothetical protein SAMN05216585_2186 [Pseudomonas chlororaphis]
MQALPVIRSDAPSFIAGKPRSYGFTGARDLTYSYSRSASTLPPDRTLG